MALNVTPSAPDADSYASLAEFEAYCLRMNYDIASYSVADQEAALRRATMYIDGTYGGRFIGEVVASDQALEWPRKDAIYRGKELMHDIIPAKVVAATCEAAFIEASNPDSLIADFAGQSGQVVREKVGDLEVQYSDAKGQDLGSVTPMFSVIDGLLLGLIAPDVAGKVSFGLALRG